MGKTEPTYLKTVEAIPAALGIKYPKQANRRARIREQILQWKERKDFPKKSSKGWRKVEVIRWGEDRGLRIEDGKIISGPGGGGGSGGGKLMKRNGDGGVAATGELPAQAEPNNGELFAIEDAKRIRIANLLNLHTEGKRLNRDERAELRAAGYDFWNEGGSDAPVASPNGDGGVAATARINDASDLCDNLTAIASKMDFHYRNPDGSSRLQFEIDAKAVSDWKKGRRLDGAPGPPGKANSRQWSARQWIEWFDAHFWLKWKKASTPQTEAFGDADLRRMQLAEEFKKLEDAQRERDIRDLKYRPVEEFDRCFTLLGAQLNRFITEHGEKNLARGAESTIKALGLPATVELPALEAVRAGCRGAADALRAELERELAEIGPEVATD